MSWFVAILALVSSAAGCGRWHFDPLEDIRQDGAAGYPGAVLADGPVAYWRLGDSSGDIARDETGNYPGTYAASCELGVPGAVPGDTAVLFDGTSCRIDVGDVLAFSGFAPFSIELWIAPNIADSSVRWLVSRNTLSGLRNGYQFHFTDTDTYFERMVDDAGEGTLSAGPLVLGGFQFLVATFDGSMHRIYRDGVEVAVANVNRAIVPMPGGFVIGDRVRGNNVKFSGALDEIAIYDRALTPAQIAAHFAAR